MRSQWDKESTFKKCCMQLNLQPLGILKLSHEDDLYLIKVQIPWKHESLDEQVQNSECLNEHDMDMDLDKYYARSRYLPSVRG